MRIGFLGPKDCDDYKIAIDSIDMCLSVADRMKIDTIMIPSFFENQMHTDEHFERTVEVLKDTCIKAQKYNITVETETPLPAEKQIELMKAVDMPNLNTFFDSQNLVWFEGYSQTENLIKQFPYLGKQIHLCDGNGFYKDNSREGSPNGGYILGTGNGEFFEQMKILMENNFDGWLITENMYWRKPLYDMGNPYELAKKDLDIVKEFVNNWA
jgi:sugar phosphate isomerase/epimerase